MTPNDAYREGRFGNSALPPANLSNEAYSQWLNGRRDAARTPIGPSIGDLLPGQKAAEFVMTVPWRIRLVVVSLILVGFATLMVRGEKSSPQEEWLGFVILGVVGGLWVVGILVSLCLPAFRRGFDRAFSPALLRKINNWSLGMLGAVVVGTGLFVWYTIQFKLPSSTSQQTSVQSFLNPPPKAPAQTTQPKLKAPHSHQHRKKQIE